MNSDGLTESVSPSLPTRDGSTRSVPPKLNMFWERVAGPLTVFVVLCGFFRRSIFGDRPLAKLDVLHNIDGLYNPNLTQAIVPLPFDPSGPLIFYPFGNFIHESWTRFTAPLWNPYVGCGYPLIGDPQSFIFSVAQLTGSFRSPSAYNFGLIGEIFLGALGLFFLARHLRLSVLASCFCALTYALIPRNLAQVDLSGIEGLFPWVFLAFLHMAKTPDASRIMLAAASVSVAAYSAHPEPALFAAAYAALFCLSTMFFSAKHGSNSRGPLLLNGLRAVGAVAGIALCLTAPVTLPFFEYLRNAFFYKDAATGASFISGEQFVSSFFSAQGSDSLFPGAVALLLLPFGLWSARKLNPGLLIAAAVCLFVTVPPPLLQPLLAIKPISYLATLYGMPELLMFLVLLAGIGLDDVTAARLSRRKLLWFLAATLLIGAVPLTVAWANAATDDWSLIMQALGEQRQLTQAVSITAFIGLVIAAVRCISARISAPCVALPLVVLNMVSVGLIGRNALPSRAPFSFELPAILENVRKDGQRVVAVGSNLFLANTSSCYRVPDLRSFSPLVPERYHKFVAACGATTHNLYFLSFPDVASPLLDLASVKFVLTRTALSSPDDVGLPAERTVLLPPARLTRGVRLLEGKLKVDEANSQIDGHLKLQVQGLAINRYALQFVITDSDGRVLVQQPQKFLQGDSFGQNDLIESVHLPVPRRPGIKGGAICNLNIVDTWTGQQMAEGSNTFDLTDGHGLRLFDISSAKPKPELAAAASSESIRRERHFRLVHEDLKSGLRLYENNKALPAAYSIARTRMLLSTSPEESLSRIQKSDFAPGASVCIEDTLHLLTASTRSSTDSCSAHDSSTVRKANLLSSDRVESLQENSEAMSTASCIKAQTFDRPDCNTVVVSAECDTPSWLVLTDLYYPGWKCTVDDREVPIYPANYLFRAVEVPEGRHTVRFSFQPATFNNGLWVSLICLLGISLIALLRVKKPPAEKVS